MRTFDGCCGSCVHLNTNDYVRTKDHCYCTERRQYYDLTEPKCRYYEYDPRKDYYDLNRRWYIVTAIFSKLKLSDKYECINLLHSFRDVLEKDSKYQPLLDTYDIIGPVIADKILKDENSEILCKNLVQAFLSDMLDLIKEEKYDEALKKYLEMLNLLISIYLDDISEYYNQKVKTNK